MRGRIRRMHRWGWTVLLVLGWRKSSFKGSSELCKNNRLEGGVVYNLLKYSIYQHGKSGLIDISVMVRNYP